MTHRPSARLLTIGEFAAATQLSPKALRLYDSERVLSPAAVGDNGYRYYRREQIAAGRLIRTLREMDVGLSAIAEIVAAPPEQTRALLCRWAQEADRRYARQKRAFQAGLALLQRAPAIDPPSIVARERPGSTVAVSTVTVTRATLGQRLSAERSRARERCAAAGLELLDGAFLVVDELPGDDEKELELAIPIATPAALPSDLMLRRLPARMCAAHDMACDQVRVADIEATLDAMFDWLDRHGCRASEAPTLRFSESDHGLTLGWAYEPFVAASEDVP